MRLCADAFDLEGMQGAAGPVCQPAALSLCAGRASPADEGPGEYSTANSSTCTSLHLKQERYTIPGLSEPHWQMPR